MARSFFYLNTLLLFFSFSFSFNLYTAERTFLAYCDKVKQADSCFSKEIFHTTKVLMNEVGTEDCHKVFEHLSQLESLDLSSQKIKDLRPLAVFTQLKALDLRDNEIESLWGLEGLKELELLHLNQNKIKDLTPLSFLKNLFVLNLSDNKVRYLAPVKELFCLKHVKLEGNPVFQSEEEMDYLEGLLFLRNFERSGLMQDPGESFLEIILLADRAALRADLHYFRNLSSIPEISSRLTDIQVFESLSEKTRRSFLAVRESKKIAKELVFSYLNKKAKNLLASNFAKSLEENIEKTLTYFLCDHPLSPSYHRELESMKTLIQKEIAHGFLLSPENLLKLVESWVEKQKEMGLPLSLKTGFSL